MRKSILTMIVCLAIAPALASAADTSEQQVVQDLGAVLAWRMGPEAATAT
jgi:hypothetical protein